MPLYWGGTVFGDYIRPHNGNEDKMFSVQKGTLNIRIKKPELDHFIDAAFLFLLFMIFTFNSAAQGTSWIYYIAYTLFCGFSAVKVIMRFRFDGRINLPAIALWYMFFSLYALSTVLWSAYPSAVFAMVARKIQIVFLLFFLAQTYSTPEGIERCLKIISWAGSCCVIYIFLSVNPSQWFSQRFGAEVTGANSYGFVLTVSALITMYFAYYEKRKLYYPLVAFQLIAIVLTASRKSILAIFAGMLLLAFLKDRSVKLLIRIAAVAAVMAIVFYVIMNNPDLYTFIGRRFETMIGYFMETENDGSMHRRQLFIEYAKQFFLEHPLIGNGEYSFSNMLNEYRGIKAYAHNNFYEILVDFGLVGFTIYYGMYAYIVVKLINPVFQQGNEKAKLILSMMAVILLCEYGIVLYYSSFALIFIAAAFMFVNSHDIVSLQKTFKTSRTVNERTI